MRQQQIRENVFSVILAHYEQPAYWRQAVDSVCMQTYPNIQLIFADDGSKAFCPQEVEEYVYRQERRGLELLIVTSWHNTGTVRSLNRAARLISGKYLAFLAADDVFCDVHVLSSYARELKKEAAKDVAGIYGRSFLCDQSLSKTGLEYVDPEEAFYCNTLDYRGQFEKKKKKCFFPIGAAAFDTERLLRFFPLDTHYRLIEDWPLFLKINHAKMRMLFCDIPVLLHRAGGVSDAACPVKSSRIQCDCDHLLFHEREIWPYVRQLDRIELAKFVRRYCKDRSQMHEAAAKMQLKPKWRLMLYDRRSRAYFHEQEKYTGGCADDKEYRNGGF